MINIGIVQGTNKQYYKTVILIFRKVVSHSLKIKHSYGGLQGLLEKTFENASIFI